MKKIIVLLVLSLVSLDAQEENTNGYELGNGVQIGSAPLYIGGYFSIDYKNSDDAYRFRVDDIALLSYGSYNKLSYMAEFEFTELYVITDDEISGYNTRSDTNLHTERLYLDYNFNENYMIKVGQFNNPIGYWNLLPINVLRDTTSNPESTSIIFPKYTTGAALNFTSYSESEFSLDILLQENDSIDNTYNNYKTDAHYGINLGYAKDDYSFKLNLGTFHETQTDKQLYYGMLSAKYDTDKIQIMSEIGSQKSKDAFTTKYAGYLQGLYRFTTQQMVVLRAESYDDKLSTGQENIGIVGYTYRPMYPIALKAEYQFHSESINNALLCSFSMMF